MTATNTLAGNPKLQRVGGLSALGMALCYVALFIVFGAFYAPPEGAEVIQRIQYMSEQYSLLATAYGVGYLLFGVFLLLTVQALHRRMGAGKSAMSETASVFGVIWVAIIFCAGMAALIGMELMIQVSEEEPQAAISLYYANIMMVEALGGGIEIVGGLWVFFISVTGLRKRLLTKWLNGLGVAVGLCGVFTVFHTLPYLKEAFGLSQIVWFLWLGIHLLRHPNLNE